MATIIGAHKIKRNETAKSMDGVKYRSSVLYDRK